MFSKVEEKTTNFFTSSWRIAAGHDANHVISQDILTSWVHFSDVARKLIIWLWWNWGLVRGQSVDCTSHDLVAVALCLAVLAFELYAAFWNVSMLQ